MTTDLLKVHPLFSSWPAEAVAILSNLLVETVYEANEVIVRQGELVDSIYFIKAGKAVVLQAVGKDLPEEIATLSEGEAIGLNERGLYSPAGERAATVIALTQVKLLKLSLKDFNDFLKNRTHLSEQLRHESNILLRMKLIKEAAPFANLPLSKINSLALTIEEKDWSANTIIFHQGDDGDYCYLVESGEVEIEHENEEGEIEKIATIKPADIFGETALLLSTPRNATAKTLVASKLLALPMEAFTNTIKETSNTLHEVTTLIIERAKPKHNPAVLSYERISKDGKKFYLLKNPENQTYVRIDENEYLIWQLMNENHSVREILMLANKHFKLTASELLEFVLGLASVDCVKIKGLHTPDETRDLARWEKWVDNIKYVMEYDFAFGNFDPKLTKLYNKWIRHLTTTPAKILFFSIGFIGLLFFFLNIPRVMAVVPQQPTFIFLALAYYIVIFFSIFHELGHAFAVKSYGREVHQFGLGWYWIGPTPFTDTSDAWLCTPWQRVIVDLAGVYINFILGGIFALLAFYSSSDSASLLCWFIALINLYATYGNIDPFIDSDGYYALSDLLDDSDLRDKAVLWLVNGMPGLCKQRHLWRQYKNEMLYWISGFVMMLMRISIAILIQQTILATYFEQAWYTWLFPIAVIVFISLGAYVDTKKRLTKIKPLRVAA